MDNSPLYQTTSNLASCDCVAECGTKDGVPTLCYVALIAQLQHELVHCGGDSHDAEAGLLWGRGKPVPTVIGGTTKKKQRLQAVLEQLTQPSVEDLPLHESLEMQSRKLVGPATKVVILLVRVVTYPGSEGATTWNACGMVPSAAGSVNRKLKE